MVVDVLFRSYIVYTCIFGTYLLIFVAVTYNRKVSKLIKVPVCLFPVIKYIYKYFNQLIFHPHSKQFYHAVTIGPKPEKVHNWAQKLSKILDRFSILMTVRFRQQQSLKIILFSTCWEILPAIKDILICSNCHCVHN